MDYVFKWKPNYQTTDFPGIETALFRVEEDGPSWLKWSFPSYETKFSGDGPLLFAERNYWIAPAGVVLYLLFVWLGPKMMAERKAFDLRTPLKYWNLFLAIFSAYGMVRCVTHLFFLLSNFGINCVFCGSPLFTVGRGSSGLWMSLFVYSKYLELIDTVFLVARKKPVSFLHWYHHSTVLLYSWDAYVSWQPAAMCFVTMNYTVHAIMYFYYYLAASMKTPPNWGIFVTVLQIAQMFVGVAITGKALSLGISYPFLFESNVSDSADPIAAKGQCFIQKTNLWFAMAMYSTYFYLFADFFVARYFHRKPLVGGTDGRKKK